VLAGAIQEDGGNGLWRDFAKRTQFALFECLGLVAIRGRARAVLVEFIDENGGGPGVRLRERQRPKQSE
jgi:hypothetical protein